MKKSCREQIRVLIFICLIPVILYYLPISIIFSSQIAGRSATTSVLQNSAMNYLPSGLSVEEQNEYFRSHGNLNYHFNVISKWPEGSRIQDAWLNDIQSQYDKFSLFFGVIEIVTICVSLFALKYRKPKLIGIFEKIESKVTEINERLRTFFQVLCSLSFGVSFFFLSQVLNLFRLLRTDVFNYLDLYSLPVPQTWTPLENTISTAWNFFHCSWLFYSALASSIILLMGLFLSDTNILPKSVNFPFFTLKSSTLMIFLVQLLYISIMILSVSSARAGYF